MLVVGRGQSGSQIADEVRENGRQLCFATGSTGRIPRRYRGQDISYRLERMGFMKQTVDQLDSPADRFRPNPHVSGKDGGKTLNLHRLFREGVTLLGHLRGADGPGLQVAPDLHWLHTPGSGRLSGGAADAAQVAAHIESPG